MNEKFKQDNIYLTERLSIRKLRREDVHGFHEMQGDYEVMKYVSEKANTEAEDEKDLADVISQYKKPGNELWIWAIELEESGSFAGTVALIKDKEDNWEIGYRLCRSMWGNGYATEAVNGLLKLCEEIPEIHNLIAYADLRNVASQKVLSKCGFVNLGIKYNDEAECEDYIYSISTT